MNLNAILAAMSCFILLSFSHFVYGKDLVWPKPEFPPFAFMQVDHELYNKGIDQLCIHYLIDALPTSWNHAFEQANYKRIVANIVAKKNSIIAGLFKTEARIASGVNYSAVPMQVTLPNQLVILKRNYEKFAPFISDGKIDIEMMMSDESLTIGASHGRSYSSIIDVVLNQHRNKIVNRITQDEKGFLLMLMAGRVDAIFEFPISIGYNAKQLGAKGEVLLIPVKGMEEYTEVYIAGPSGEWGTEVMAKINGILANPLTIQTFARFYSDWLPNPDSVV